MTTIEDARRYAIVAYIERHRCEHPLDALTIAGIRKGVGLTFSTTMRIVQDLQRDGYLTRGGSRHGRLEVARRYEAGV